MSRPLQGADDWPEPLIRHHPAARRMKLRVDPETGQAVVTVPRGLPDRTALDFVRRQADWIAVQRQRLVPRHLFADGEVFSLLGQDTYIVHDSSIGRKLHLHEDELIVGGPSEHVNRRVTDWLKAHARDRFREISPPMAARIDRKIGTIRVGDPKTRWGSCSGRGTLSFNWRLVLAPVRVFDYVAAHEVAHLKHMDHSPAFWSVVQDIYGSDPTPARNWLKKHGRNLRGWG